MAIVALYFLICAVRTSMPKLSGGAKARVFLMRIAAAAVGLALAYGFLWLCTHGKGVRDPDDARQIMWLLLGVCIATGEYLSRRYLRSLNFFPQNRMIPWTY